MAATIKNIDWKIAMFGFSPFDSLLISFAMWCFDELKQKMVHFEHVNIFKLKSEKEPKSTQRINA